MIPIPAIETPRLRLRAHRPSDKPAIYAAYADERFTRFITREQRALTSEEAWRSVAVIPGSWALNGFGMWLVEERATGEAAGAVGPWQPEGWPGFEIGWNIFPAHWGKGYATEAAAAAFAWVRATLGRDTVIHLIDPANHPSEAVARRLGSNLTDERKEFPNGSVANIWRTRWDDFVRTDAGAAHVATGPATS